MINTPIRPGGPSYGPLWIAIFYFSFFLLSGRPAQAQTWNVNGTSIYNANTGNVGIGTSNPVIPFHVVGNMAATEYSNNALTGFVQSWADNAIIWKSGNGAINGLRFGSATDLQAGNWSEKMRISDNGNVGIGMVPQFKLHLFTTSTNDGIGMLTPNSFLLFHGDLTQGAWNNMSQVGDGGIIYGTGNGVTNIGFVIAPWNLATTGIRVDGNGNVGICAPDTKGYQLAVNGQAIFNKVVVKPYPWPDFVFDSAYRLAPLGSVEKFIQANHHLPDVPAADSVERNGIDVGGSQALLLKKIEELTLYVIELDKKNKDLQRQINRLKKKTNK